MARPIMILGCTSDAGKSLIVAGLCRMLANRGIRVAPFKAQNMSNNAAVTQQGGEIGRAQYLQAIAARIEPDLRMNPVLIKPMADTLGQTLVNGHPCAELEQVRWTERRPILWPYVCKALSGLMQDFDQLVIEGAGSPAEVNLRKSDIVNMSVALECHAEVYLVADIDKGGSFAHLLGTWACLAPEEQQLIKGFVLNKFRGDPSLLKGGKDWLENKTGIPTVAVIPFLPFNLPEEDTLHHRASFHKGCVNIALIAYPYAANLDEFDALTGQAGVNLVPARSPDDLERPLCEFDAVILPGSKHTVASLQTIRANGMAQQICQAAREGVQILGICGGLQILGDSILDIHGVEGGSIQGLGLLPLDTQYNRGKRTAIRRLNWQGHTIRGYEIHHGKTHSQAHLQAYIEEGMGWQHANVRACYLHGLFDNSGFMTDYLHQLGWQGQSEDWQTQIDVSLDRIAYEFEQLNWL